MWTMAQIKDAFKNINKKLETLDASVLSLDTRSVEIHNLMQEIKQALNVMPDEKKQAMIDRMAAVRAAKQNKEPAK